MQQILRETGSIILYFMIAAGSAIGSRFLIKIPNELFRKILHCILLGSLLMFTFAYGEWWISALAAIIFEIIVYPLLIVLERFKNFSEITTERKKGELKSSLLLVFTMYAVVVTICWGWLGDKYLALAAIYAWGFGDAAAALIGKKFGKHKIKWKCTDGKKSVEGSLSMFLVSVISVLIILSYRGGMSIVGMVTTAFVTAAVSMLAELCSKDGNDTVICPVSAMMVLVPLVYLFGGLS